MATKPFVSNVLILPHEYHEHPSLEKLRQYIDTEREAGRRPSQRDLFKTMVLIGFQDLREQGGSNE